MMHSRFNALKNRDISDLEGSKAAVIGLGATGSVMAEHLARHGVKLVLIDRDFLEENDLYSSNIYSREQIEKALPKSKACEQKLSDFTEVEARVENADREFVENLDVDVILDGADNVETRYIIDEYSETPWIYTAALGERGLSMFIEKACFRCMMDSVNPKKSCETSGILREISSIAASRSAAKAVDYLSGREVEEKLEIIPEMESFRPEECSCSGKKVEASQVCGEQKYQVFGDKEPGNFDGEEIASNPYLRKIRFEGRILTVFNSGRAIVEADSLEAARKAYRMASSI
ncbi:MAG: ThiF family adenylyltransferase [Candidatus Nanohaloarchaea archaeon]